MYDVGDMVKIKVDPNMLDWDERWMNRKAGLVTYVSPDSRLYEVTPIEEPNRPDVCRSIVLEEKEMELILA